MSRRCFVSAIWLQIVLLVPAMAGPVPVADPGQYLGPIDVVASPDATTLYVVQYDGKRIDAVDVAAGKVVRSVACPSEPTGVALNSDGSKMYITCGGPDGLVLVADTASGNIAAEIRVGHTPNSPLVSPDGKRLYVCNRFNNDVSVIDLESGEEIQRVPAIREPVAAAITPDGARVFVANLLPVDAADSYDVSAEVTVIETDSLETSNIRLVNGSSSVFGICVSPDGKYAYVAHILSRYQMPTTQLERGWMNTNALSILDVDSKSRVNTVLLDDIDLGAANPWAVTTTADGKTILVSHAGTHEVSAIDADGLHEKLANIPKTMEEAKAAGRYDGRGTYSSITVDDVPNDLAFLVDLRRRITLRRGGHWGMVNDDGPLINGPRGLDVIGTTFYTALYFSDALAAVDLEDKSYYPVKLIPLGPEPEFTVQRRGNMIWHDADFCFQKWQSCASCHPSVRVDGLNWDLLNDGIGNPKNTKSMLLSHQTPPSMSLGVRSTAEIAVRAGFRHIQFAVVADEVAAAVDEFLKALEPVPSPYLVDGELSESAQRGKGLFFDETVGCAKCHPAPLYTDLKMHNVGYTGKFSAGATTFDTPTLIEAWRTAPYMHDGHFTTMEQLLIEHQHGSYGGNLDGLSDQDFADLVEFVLSL
jgi:YVTN family beta-propeller protein